MKSIKSNYSEKGLWNKIKKYAKIAGKELIEKVLWLYYAMQRPDCPAWAKAVIIGALAYFILPTDAIPDVLPGIGYTDDLAVVMAALGTVSIYVDKEVKRKAKEKLSDWFD